MEIILIIILFLVLSVFGFVYFIQNKKIKNLNQSFKTLNNEHLAENEKLTNEIKRQNYIIATYQKQLGNSATIQENSFQEANPQNTENEKITDFALERERLEDEKRKFQEKNKKLWEQSIAIHREKERIDSQKKIIETEHKHLTDSILYAKRIQSALLPTFDLLNTCLPKHFILWKPRDIVSGDFYWIKQVPDNVVIVAADCTGHGVPGAFMSALGIAFLNEIVNQHMALEANIVLEELRELVKTSLHQTGEATDTQDGMDLALCIINTKTNLMKFSGANNTVCIVRNNELIELEATKNPIGVFFREKEFNNTEFQLKIGDVCYMFSDGYSDEFGGVLNRKFSTRRFKELLLEMNIKGLTISEQKAYLEKTLIDWLGEENKQIDDILVVGFQI